MLWLRSREEYDCLATFEPSVGTLKKYSLRALGDKAPSITDGCFSEVEEGILILYRSVGNIFFQIYNKIFLINDKIEIEVFGPREKRKLQVVRDGKVIYETTYTPPGPGMIEGDPTPFVEEEHFDFGLFVSNISKNPGRKDRFLGKE